MILDGERLTENLHGEQVDPREHLIRMYPPLAELAPPLDHVVLTARPLVARVNHGTWIASCECGARGVPTPGCVVFTGTLLGWCLRCRNGATGRGWRPILVPVEAIRHQIEAVLLCRPNVDDRNWEPGETIDDLLAQNREHGDPVPDLRPQATGALAGPDWRSIVAPFGQRLRRELGQRWWQKLLGRR